MKKIGVLLCTATKKDYPCEVWEMYDDSRQFKAKRIFMDCVFDEWYVNTHKYGFMEPNKFIEPYESHDSNIEYYRITTLDMLSQDKIDEWLELLDKQFPNKEEIELHCHMSTMTYKAIAKIFPNTIHIKPRPQQTSTAKYYIQATENYMGGMSLNEVYDILNKPHRVYEQPRWWYHNEYDDFLGTTAQLERNSNARQGGLERLYKGYVLHTKGWVIDKSLLKDIHKNSNGRYSYKGDKKPAKKSNNELVNKLAELDNKYGKRKI